jgi:excinuclease ABC subunit C
MAKNELKIYSHIPACPGVYLMKDAKDTIIYIGKSTNLKARVRSYFMAWASLNFAKKKMVKIVEKIDYIETKSDIEALMLETNLIKKNQPKYNVLMKDGKNLSYIKITDSEIPCLIRTRIRTNHGQYFWPYSQYFDTYRYVRFIRKLFQLGNHDSIDTFGPPCMDTYIGLCPGHCTGEKEKIALYKERIARARDFLMGKQEDVILWLQDKMKHAASERRYEDAANYKNLIEQIESAGSKQIVRDAIVGDATVIVTLDKYDHTFMSFVEVKNSMIVGIREYKLSNPLDEKKEDLIHNAIIQYIAEEWVKTLYTDIPIEIWNDLSMYIQSEKIHLKQPSRWEKVRILEFAHTNLLNFAYQEEMSGFKNATLSKKTMCDLLEKLWFEIKTLEKKKDIIFECFDISHSHGEHTVASKSVLINGKPEPKKYKKYRIKTLKTGRIDDFASMEEILSRRTIAALKEEDPWPDLIIIDGGKGQLSYAVSAIRGEMEKWSSREADEAHTPLLNQSTIPPIISLAKRIEEVFLPENSEPILLEKWSGELMILQKIRDEAHRFAINYNRSSREKSYTKTLLDEIPGIWPVARKKILSAVSRVEELASWTFEKSHDAFGKKTAEALQDHGLIQW